MCIAALVRITVEAIGDGFVSVWVSLGGGNVAGPRVTGPVERHAMHCVIVIAIRNRANDRAKFCFPAITRTAP